MTENKIAIDTLEAMKKQFLPPTRDILDMAIQALEEIQQYRAIGTVEQLEWCKDASHWKELFKEKLEQYEAIGTIEEFKALKEKNTSKKVEYQGEHEKCPTCGSFYVFGRHCTECGQAVDYD